MKIKRYIPLISVIFVNLSLFLTKLYIGISSSSLCIYSDSINNLIDTLSAAAALTGLYFSFKPPSEEFPNGYKKINDLTGFVMSCSVLITGLYLGYMAVERLLYPVPVAFQIKYCVLLLITIAVKITVGLTLGFTGLGSKMIIYKTIITDSFTDAAVTAMSILSFIVSARGLMRFDAGFGIIISLIITVNAVKLLKTTVSILIK